MVTSIGQTEIIEDVIDVDPGSGCRFAAWRRLQELNGVLRRRPAQPATVLTGSASSTLFP